MPFPTKTVTDTALPVSTPYVKSQGGVLKDKIKTDQISLSFASALEKPLKQLMLEKIKATFSEPALAVAHSNDHLVKVDHPSGFSFSNHVNYEDNTLVVNTVIPSQTLHINLDFIEEAKVDDIFKDKLIHAVTDAFIKPISTMLSDILPALLST